MGTVKFSEKILINKEPLFVFDYTQNYSNRLSWDTFLKKAELIGDAEKPDIGVKAWCVARNGLGMETKYVTFNRPKNTAVKMTRGPFMFKSFSGSWLFRELGHEQTEVAFIYSFGLRFPFDIFKRLIKNSLHRNVRKRLIDLKTCVERT